jgi:hypothetical protein
LSNTQSLYYYLLFFVFEEIEFPMEIPDPKDEKCESRVILTIFSRFVRNSLVFGYQTIASDENIAIILSNIYNFLDNEGIMTFCSLLEYFPEKVTEYSNDFASDMLDIIKDRCENGSYSDQDLVHTTAYSVEIVMNLVPTSLDLPALFEKYLEIASICYNSGLNSFQWLEFPSSILYSEEALPCVVEYVKMLMKFANIRHMNMFVNDLARPLAFFLDDGYESMMEDTEFGEHSGRVGIIFIEVMLEVLPRLIEVDLESIVLIIVRIIQTQDDLPEELIGALIQTLNQIMSDRNISGSHKMSICLIYSALRISYNLEIPQELLLFIFKYIFVFGIDYYRAMIGTMLLTFDEVAEIKSAAIAILTNTLEFKVHPKYIGYEYPDPRKIVGVPEIFVSSHPIKNIASEEEEE